MKRRRLYFQWQTIAVLLGAEIILFCFVVAMTIASFWSH